MKATGIVRRIEARVIITQKRLKALYSLGLREILEKKFWRKTAYLNLYIAKARWNSPRFINILRNLFLDSKPNGDSNNSNTNNKRNEDVPKNL